MYSIMQHVITEIQSTFSIDNKSQKIENHSSITILKWQEIDATFSLKM